MKNIKHAIMPNKEFNYLDDSTLLAVLEFSDLQDSNARNEISQHLKVISSTIKKLSIDT